MSMMFPIEIKCPKCGTIGEAMKHNSINVSLDPGNKKKVLDRSLFDWHCEKCGATVHLEYCPLYHDMNEKYMILVVPDVEAARTEKVPVRDEYKEFMDGYKFRVVCKIDGLIEKISIFDSGLDDFAVEMLKMLLWPKLDSPKEIIFAGAADAGIGFFVRYDDAEKNTGINVPGKYYDSCAETVQKMKVDSSVQYVDIGVIAEIINKTDSL